jgi:hypothetical protein
LIRAGNSRRDSTRSHRHRVSVSPKRIAGVERSGGPLRSGLNEVLPHGDQVRAPQGRFEPSSERDRLPLVVGASVPQKLMKLVGREHRAVSGEGRRGPRRSLGAPVRIWEDVGLDLCSERFDPNCGAVVDAAVDDADDRLGARNARYERQKRSSDTSSCRPTKVSKWSWTIGSVSVGMDSRHRAWKRMAWRPRRSAIRVTEVLGSGRTVQFGDAPSRRRVRTPRGPEPRDAQRTARRGVRAVAVEPATPGAMRDAFGPRTKRWEEPRRTHRFDGMLGPAHGPRTCKSWTRENPR